MENTEKPKLSYKQKVVTILAIVIIGYFYYYDELLSNAQFNVLVGIILILWFLIGFIRIEFKKRQ